MMPKYEEMLYLRLLRSPRMLESVPRERAQMIMRWKMVRFAQRDLRKQRARKRRR